MNNALFLNVSEWSFFCFGVYFYCCLFLLFYFVLVFNCFFSTIKIILSSVLDAPLVIKAKRNAVGLFQGSLAEDGTMFVLSYFCT